MSLPTITELVTHDGKFHADEVLATVVLSGLFPAATVIRSRDRALIAPAPGRIIYDVGAAFDPVQGLFDHHQPGAPLRECGTPYSAFGLIWREFGHLWLAECMKAEHGKEAFRRIDEELVRVVDAVDNGKLAPLDAGRFDGLTIFSMISDFVPGWREESERAFRLAFERAVGFAATFLKGRARSILAELEASELVRRRIERSDGPVLVLQQGMPWQGAVSEPGAEHILMVVHPRSDGRWIISTVPKEPGSYETRMDLPLAWAGLEHGALQTVSGIASAIFCHRARFMAVAGSAEDAVAMAEAAIRIEGLTATLVR